MRGTGGLNMLGNPLYGDFMNNAIALGRARDPAFTHEVEKRSGQDIAICYQCGNCTAGCPAGFVYDRQVNQIMRGVQLGLKEQVLSCRSLWYCLSCSMCSLRCPNNIDVAAVMETLRHMARENGFVTVPEVEKFWLSFLDTVRAFGRTYEVGTMALYMIRALKLTTDLDLAPAALKRSKLPFIPHFAKGRRFEGASGIIDRFRKRLAKEGGEE